MLRLDHYDILDKIPKPGSPRDQYRALRSTVPVGTSGKWSVERFEVKKDLKLMRSMRDGRGTPPGQYTRLYHATRGVIMTDTDAEIGDLQFLFRRAAGRVLVHGLGLGIALAGLLAKREVTHVDVVELDANVIKLVGHHFTDPRLVIHHGDCLTHKWPKSIRWDVAWHDIWDNICEDNKPQMIQLKRRFARRVTWQHCWAQEWLD